MAHFPDSSPPLGTDAQREADTREGIPRHLHVRQLVSNRYEILEKLGRGAVGDVWRVYDLKLRVEVALKSVRRTIPDAAEALRREVRTAREVISPNVCRIFDLVVEEGQELVSMEYIDGLTLLSLLQERSPLELREAREIASQFLAGLEAIHKAGLVHRDLKPENIMITQTGRVVVMDFGIAEPVAQISGTISGTVPYMAPEQLSGGKIDARSDVFAAGVLLAEMISPVRDHKSRKMVWNAVREDPPKLPDTPWQAVIARAVAKYPDDRFPSAGELSRALEEVTQRVGTIEERKPYPGLSSFTEGDAEYFLGRELEAETVLKKLQELHLMAIIGPSGAGKTSFLRAGLIPVLPKGLSYVFSMPGDSPLVNLGQALAAEFSGDTEAIRKMVRLENMDDALWLLHRWRLKHSEALLIVDRFEELFTLNDHEVQTHFAELLGRAVLEADVRLLLAMRDDFLILCREHVSLTPIFSELTALLPLSGPALRRALIQPALQCGYRFEDEALVDEILRDVEKERGALPLMAFAAARLWEKRDRKHGLLTREAYQQIGGVAGALAQHAEATMDRIGSERQGIVREIFRNLVTAQNTRAARDAGELLSIFQNRNTAQEVLRILIDARLLTSFEASQTEEEQRRRIEIIHESLLTAWPRLVRWQTQDADSAQFRDQLRQAAQVWDERGHPADLLWRGSSYKEFEVWREKYSGGLTITEKAFSEAMLDHEKSKRRKRRVLLSAIFVILLSILGVIAGFWKGEKKARQEAVTQAQRSEASKLVALGRMELDQDPTLALAYAIASLERADTPVGRRFALQALWKGPPAFIMTDLPVGPSFLNFNQNGKWLAAGGVFGARLLSSDAKHTIVLPTYAVTPELAAALVRLHKLGIPTRPQFSPDGHSVVWSSDHEPETVLVWSIPQRKNIRRFKTEGFTLYLVRGSVLILITDLSGARRYFSAIRTWAFDDNEPRIVGRSNCSYHVFDISNDASWLACGKGRRVYIRPLAGMEDTPGILVGEHEHNVLKVSFHPNGKQIASADDTGEIRIWSLSGKSNTPIRKFDGKGPLMSPFFLPIIPPGHPFFNSSGSILAVSYEDKSLRLWDMNGPAEADPFVLRRSVVPPAPYIAFDPSNRWITVNYNDSLAFWPIVHTYPYVLNGKGLKDEGTLLTFTQDGKQLASWFNDGSIRLWKMNDLQAGGRDLTKTEARVFFIKPDPAGRYLALATWGGPALISLADGRRRNMPGAKGAGDVFLSPNGRFLAAESFGTIPVWNIESDEVRILKPDKKLTNVLRVGLSSDGSLFSGHENGSVYKWNLQSETYRLLVKGNKPVDRIVGVKNNPDLIVCLWIDIGVDAQKASSELRVVNVRTGNSYLIHTHGHRVSTLAVDPSGKILVTGDMDGVVRVGPITGEEPHLLFGHQSGIKSIAVDPDRRWIASSENDRPVIRLWPMPKGKPLHTLPYDELLKKLQSLTNARVVEDEKSSTGYRVQFGPFPGWEKVSTW
jgi:serine/threonine protein kinase/WD40 repeat protein